VVKSDEIFEWPLTGHAKILISIHIYARRNGLIACYYYGVRKNIHRVTLSR